MNIGELGILGIIIAIILVIIGIWFGIITASYIATAVGAVGVDWWIVAVTIFSALGGCSSSFIKIGGD